MIFDLFNTIVIIIMTDVVSPPQLQERRRPNPQTLWLAFFAKEPVIKTTSGSL